MKQIYPRIWAVLFPFAIFFSCNKATNQPGGNNFNTTEESVINDFVNEVALSQYNNLVQAVTNLDQALNTLNTNPTDANLLAAQNTWRTIRSKWEQCEGFLFGPVEDQDYDPNTDTWPTDYTQMDSLLASNNPLQPADIRNLPQSLRGYHPIEYIFPRRVSASARHTECILRGIRRFCLHRHSEKRQGKFNLNCAASPAKF